MVILRRFLYAITLSETVPQRGDAITFANAIAIAIVIVHLLNLSPFSSGMKFFMCTNVRWNFLCQGVFLMTTCRAI